MFDKASTVNYLNKGSQSRGSLFRYPSTHRWHVCCGGDYRGVAGGVGRRGGARPQDGRPAHVAAVLPQDALRHDQQERLRGHHQAGAQPLLHGISRYQQTATITIKLCCWFPDILGFTSFHSPQNLQEIVAPSLQSPFPRNISPFSFSHIHTLKVVSEYYHSLCHLVVIWNAIGNRHITYFLRLSLHYTSSSVMKWCLLSLLELMYCTDVGRVGPAPLDSITERAYSAMTSGGDTPLTFHIYKVTTWPAQYFLIKPPATSSPSSTSCWPSSPTARASSCSGWWKRSPRHHSPLTAPLSKRGTRRGWRRRWRRSWRGGWTPGAGGGRCLCRGDRIDSMYYCYCLSR